MRKTKRYAISQIPRSFVKRSLELWTMKIRRAISVALLGMVGLAVSAQTRQDSIHSALEYQLEHYPSSQYRDVYKNFMQDYFGPGHILNDTVAAGNYLRYELNNSEKFEGPDYETTGFEGNFYRVNIRLIKDGTIPYPAFFDAFVESVQAITPPDGETWMRTWREIDGEIRAMGLAFPNEAQDRADLTKQFSQEDYVVHHSQAFNEANHFHYRIIARDKFLRSLLPLIERTSGN